MENVVPPLILGIDFNNVFMSSVFKDSETNSKGVPISGIKNFLYRIKSFKDSFNPNYIIMANDIGRDLTFRRKLYKPYKAQRKSYDPSISVQMEYASRIISLIGYRFINNPLFEADDILGMVSKYAAENEMHMVIVSSDKDMYQLINDNVFIFSPRGKDFIDSDWVFENYRITPDQWIESKMLQGDKSDNVPGIDGIGEVTALKLLQQYNTIENIYEHLNSLKPAIRQALQLGKCRLPLVRELVTIVTDYNAIEFNGSLLEYNEPFVSDLYELLNDLELTSLTDIMKHSLLPNNLMNVEK